MLFSLALRVANLIESAESSIPPMVVKSGESVIAKSPVPQYASTRWVGGGVRTEDGIAVREGRTELLFWKNELAWYSKIYSLTLSRMVVLWSVMQTCFSSAVDKSSTASVCDSRSTVGPRESRKSKETSFVYEYIFLWNQIRRERRR
jgi:hypothetical protein